MVLNYKDVQKQALAKAPFFVFNILKKWANHRILIKKKILLKIIKD